MVKPYSKLRILLRYIFTCYNTDVCSYYLMLLLVEVVIVTLFLFRARNRTVLSLVL